jgi:vacuolar-type H+-ATPase subunit I/STV1
MKVLRRRLYEVEGGDEHRLRVVPLRVQAKGLRTMTINSQEYQLEQIGKYLQEFTSEFGKGMQELRESQKLASVQMQQELRESQKLASVQMQELRESQKQTDAQILELDKLMEKVIKESRAIQKKLGDLGLVQGEVAEELFYRNVSGLFIPLNLRFERVRRNVKIKGARGEYDIVADSDGRVLVVEVKNKLSRRMVDEFMEKKLPRFKELLPEYRNRRVVAGIGALVVKDDVGRYAEKAGLYVLTQSSDGGAALLNRKVI